MKKAILLLLAAFAAGVAGQELEVPALDDFGGGTGTLMAAVLKAPIPILEFEDTPLEDALEFLRAESIELDEFESDPLKKGINIILRTPPGWGASAVSLDDKNAFSFSEGTRSPMINLKLTNVPFREALRYVAELAGLELRIEKHAVVLAPPPEDAASLVDSLGAKVKRLANGEEVAMPSTLFEALQSERRIMEARDERLKSQGVAARDPRRVALGENLVKTQKKIAEARELLMNFLTAEKALAEEWVGEVGE